MKKTEALELMIKKVEGIRELFNSLPFDLKIEKEFLTSSLKDTDKIERARIIAVSLIISDKERGTEEFSLTLCAETKGGRIKENELSVTFTDYEKEAEELLKRLTDSPSPSDELVRVVKETNEESEIFRKEMIKKIRLSMILTVIGFLLSVGAIVLTTLLA